MWRVCQRVHVSRRSMLPCATSWPQTQTPFFPSSPPPPPHAPRAPVPSLPHNRIVLATANRVTDGAGPPCAPFPDPSPPLSLLSPCVVARDLARKRIYCHYQHHMLMFDGWLPEPCLLPPKTATRTPSQWVHFLLRHVELFSTVYFSIFFAPQGPGATSFLTTLSAVRSAHLLVAVPGSTAAHALFMVRVHVY